MSDDENLLADIAAIAGTEIAEKIADARGGTRITIPTRAKMGHWLTDLVGIEQADKICRGLSYIDNEGRARSVPETTLPLSSASLMRRMKTELFRLLEDGMSTRDIALTLGIHERTVFRARAKMKAAAINPQTAKVVEKLIRIGRADKNIAKITLLKPDQVRALRAQLSKKGKLSC